MARVAVFASGNGSNFQTIAEKIRATSHTIEFLLCNRKDAYVLERAKALEIPVRLVSYKDKTREQAEKEILREIRKSRIDLIALAGFMKILSPWFLTRFQGDILNLHPSLLPKYPGTDAIKRSYESGDSILGISVIRIDAGVDTGPVLFRTSFERRKGMTLEQAEEEIHRLEHQFFPEIIVRELDKIESRKGR